MDFNDSQYEAIRHGPGPALVTAGPGSGKTTVIVNRLLYLIRELDVSPEQIMVATFTKAAAEEMEERFRSVCKDAAKIPVFGTLHSIFYRILKSGIDPSLKIIPQKQQNALIRKELYKAGLYTEDPELLADRILNEISRLKNSANLEGSCSFGVSGNHFPEIFRSYQTFLEQNHMMDYDDILIRTGKLLSSRDDLLKKWQNRYHYILVDEFQDINPVQYQILRMLALPQNNLFAVGDENQCIYGFRGSSPRSIQQFYMDYPGCARIFLDVNYRSSETIIRRSCLLLEAGGIHLPAPVRAGSEREGSVFTVYRFPGQKEEAQYLVAQIRQYLSLSVLPEQIAVLLRSSREIPPLLRFFSESGIPCSCPGQQDFLRDHFIVRDICSYFRAASRKEDRQDLLRIINRPFRMISRTLLSDAPCGSCLDQLLEQAHNDPVLLITLRKLDSQLAFLQQLTSYAGIEYLLHVIGYRSFLLQFAKEHGIEAKQYDPVLNRLKELAKAYPSQDIFLKQLLDPAEETRRYPMQQKGCVSIDTMHASKGKEYDVVFLPRLNKGIIPAGGDLGTSVEEERRILYVAMTRARYMLHLSFSEYIHQKRVLPSVFVADLLRHDASGCNSSPGMIKIHKLTKKGL